ncbi:GGDEF domain-containing protein [Rugamonas apoptosis]|uniref:diguanylate cyclase n=1 Tax=Rugamonas apoptosis TaxID=2758570 RepID=A0A7W2FA97_9BURK|nr:GGDEF domain-containing protein [Rugamonas apoptosis]MBA5687914.1 GGDEF domain-containing protein [Rugamonas apoptosis]
MNRSHDILHPRAPNAGASHLSPAQPGLESLRRLPLLGTAMLLLGAMLYSPHLEAWERVLILLVLVAGGAGLALQTILAPAPTATPARANASAGAGSEHPASPRPALRLVHGGQPQAPDQPEAEAAPAANRSATDPLTGSYSQHECRKMLALMFVRAGRFHSPLALVLVRVEQLDYIGTLFGPGAADAVLVELAALLHHQLRGSDVVARWDDGAFALLLPGTTSEEAGELAARLHRAIGDAFFAGFSQLSCAIGVADSRQHASTEALAEAAMRLASPIAQRRNA